MKVARWAATFHCQDYHSKEQWPSVSLDKNALQRVRWVTFVLQDPWQSWLITCNAVPTEMQPHRNHSGCWFWLALSFCTIKQCLLKEEQQELLELSISMFFSTVQHAMQNKTLKIQQKINISDVFICADYWIEYFSDLFRLSHASEL